MERSDIPNKMSLVRKCIHASHLAGGRTDVTSYEDNTSGASLSDEKQERAIGDDAERTHAGAGHDDRRCRRRRLRALLRDVDVRLMDDIRDEQSACLAHSAEVCGRREQIADTHLTERRAQVVLHLHSELRQRQPRIGDGAHGVDGVIEDRHRQPVLQPRQPSDVIRQEHVHRGVVVGVRDLDDLTPERRYPTEPQRRRRVHHLRVDLFRPGDVERPPARAPLVEPEAPGAPEVDGVDEHERRAAVDGATRKQIPDLLHRPLRHPLVDEAATSVGVGGEVEALRVGAVVADAGGAEGTTHLEAVGEEQPVGDTQVVGGTLRAAVQRRQKLPKLSVHVGVDVAEAKHLKTRRERAVSYI